MKNLLLLFFPLFLEAQDVAIGEWKEYLSYNAATYIAEADNKIYCVSNGGLYFINKQDETINRLSKVTNLSDVGIKQVAYSESLNTSIITYENCNIDLLKNNQIINISDIKRKEITGLKSINNITLKDGIAYLSSTFGLVLIDLEKEEIKDTYSVGEQSENIIINGCAFLGDSIIVATTNGMYFSDIYNANLSDNYSWTLYNNSYSTYDNVLSYNGNTNIDHYTSIISISYNNNTRIRTRVDKIEITKDNGTYSELTHEAFEDIQYAWIDNESVIWVADKVNGLLKFRNYEYHGSYNPEGPIINDIYSLEFEGDKLYNCHGGHADNGQNASINDGISIKNKYDDWVNYDRYKLGNARDILEVATKNGMEYYASWNDGISVINNGELVIKYGYENTNGILDTTYYSKNRIRISDLKFDNNGNLWGLSSEVNRPLFVKKKNGEWHSFTMNQNQVALFFDDLLIDQWNQKWGIIGRSGGLFVYNDNNTIDNPNDDQYKILNTIDGNGALPTNSVLSITEDLDGEIWVGTSKGITVFYSPSSIFSSSNFDAQQILIQEGDYGQYLLSTESIKCITIDGANRKWIGTKKSGVFLLSEDGLEQILHFTAENSPLFSNEIIDIAINAKNGEVFFGTEKGLISYRSDATGGEEEQAETHVFPNPVRESYSGTIAINGLITNANVKITDIDGNLVFESFAKGGQAIWNGKNKNGERASTGVYLVFSTDANGIEKTVSKILFIN